MAGVPACSAAADPSPSRGSLCGLDGVNFFLAALLTSFGPYVAAYLAEQKWTHENIGFVLTAGSLASLLSQLPSGEALDAFRSKRALLALAALMVSVSALILAFRASLPVVFAGLVLQGSTGGLLGPAIGAISLGLVGSSVLAERLGRNKRFASAGGLAAAGIFGLLGFVLSFQAIFLAGAALLIPLLLALARIRPEEIHFSRSCGASQDHPLANPPRARRLSLWTNHGLVIFAVCLFLFQLANASVLPLAGEALAQREPRRSSILLSALIVVPQVVVAVAAPWAARQAKRRGRRPLLLIGFGALPLRALLFAFITDPSLLIGCQLLDGVSGTVLGVLTTLVVADLTAGSGRFNLAQGVIGTASGVGAAVSTTLTGLLAGSFGRAGGFLGVAVAALLATGILAVLMPETRTHSEASS